MPQPRPSPGRKDHGPTVGQSHRAQSSDRGWIRSAPGDRWRHARARNRQAYRWPRQGRVDPRGKTSSTTCTGLSGWTGYPPVSMRTGCRSPGIIASRAPLSSRRWAPPFFNNGLDPDTTEGALDLVYALPNMRVEYLRVEPPGIPTAFWRSVGPSHNRLRDRKLHGRAGGGGEARSGRLSAGSAWQVAPRQGRPRACRRKGLLGTAVAARFRPRRLTPVRLCDLHGANCRSRGVEGWNGSRPPGRLRGRRLW